MARACVCLSISKLDDDDYIFLKEYCSIFEPIADTLKYVQKNNNPFGSYLPALFGLRYKLNQLTQANLEFCSPLASVIYDGFVERFSDMMNINSVTGKSMPLFLGMFTNPMFKMSYMDKNMTNPMMFHKVQSILLSAGEEEMRNDNLLTANEQENAERASAAGT